MGARFLSRRESTIAARHELPAPKGRAPKGLEDLAQGFNPGNRHPKRFALMKGRQIERSYIAKVQL
jgi:hypothetical protein